MYPYALFTPLGAFLGDLTELGCFLEQFEIKLESMKTLEHQRYDKSIIENVLGLKGVTNAHSVGYSKEL